MAGLTDLISNTAQQTTTMPTWFDTAQQNVVNQAGQANAAAPAPGQTVAQNAVNALSGPTNAFTQAGGTLQNIASGAANPWITDPTTGQVTPNTSTAMGGLFQAQNQQLQQLAPNIMDPVTAGGTASGQFGSLRTSTAADKALTDAQANLFATQNQAALSNQATGVNAGIGAGNVAQQNINNLLTTGQYQQAAPFTNVSNYGKVLGGIQAPTTVSNQTQLSPLNQIAGLTTALGGTNPAGILGSLFGAGSAAVGKPGDANYQAAVSPGLLAGAYNSVFGPSTPSSIPAGLTYNASTKQYTDGGGNFYTMDSSGKLVDTSGNAAPSQYQTTNNIPTSTTGDTASGSGSSQPDPNYNPANNPPPLSWTDTASGSGSTQPDPNYDPNNP